MRKEFIEPEVEVVDFEVEEAIAEKYLHSDGYYYDDDDPWS